jgi:tryptophan synthase alpha chain
MNRIDQTFTRLKKSGRKALIGYVTAGFPTKAGFPAVVKNLEKAGLDMLEIGVPFSDPVADGPTIQRASQKALQNGVTLDWVLRTSAALRRDATLPIILMSYSNPILAMGLDRFFARAKQSGVDGVIIPDLTPEEGKAFESSAGKHGTALIYLAAPTTDNTRLHRIAHATHGFLYAVSLTGVTGARAAVAPDLARFLSRIRRSTSKPVAVGFGISTPDHVRSVRRHADGIIVGSALINHLEKSVQSASRFVTSLQAALNSRKESNHAS